MWDRAYGYLVSAIVVGALLYPLQVSPPRDSFPLSTFPMFSKARPPFADIDHVVAVDAAGASTVLPPGMVASDEVLQAKVAVTTVVRRGRKAAVELCLAVAQRVAADPEHAAAVRVEVRSDRYQVDGYFSGARQPVSSSVHARCPVRR
jgi:hypothetical protein